MRAQQVKEKIIWRIRVATTLVAWLVAFVIAWTILGLFGRQLESLPTALNAFIFTGILVPIMGNLVMPTVSRMVANRLKGGSSMKQYLLLYKGPAVLPDASHAGWPEWFQSLGDALADQGAPMAAGLVVSATGSGDTTPTSLNGYSIIRAEDSPAARALVADHPYLAVSHEYVIELFELTGK